MNFQTDARVSIKVLVVNALLPDAQLAIVKMLSGSVFGEKFMLQLILLVFQSDVEAAQALKLELEKSALQYTDSISIISDLPKVTDADVFCFFSNFSNPNNFEFAHQTSELYDSQYLVLKIAANFIWPHPIPTKKKLQGPFTPKVQRKLEEKPLKKLIMADGVAALDIIKNMSTDLPDDIMFCSTSLPGIATTVLAEYLKVKTHSLNELFAWAANDNIFHVEFKEPLIKNDIPEVQSKCDWKGVGKEMSKSLQYDQTKFSASWMKKEYIEKVRKLCMNNPHGPLCRAMSFVKALNDVWRSRLDPTTEYNANVGVISDGSMQTLKGYPYVLPVIFKGDEWRVNQCFPESPYVMKAIKDMNAHARNSRFKLLRSVNGFDGYEEKTQEITTSHSYTSTASRI